MGIERGQAMKRRLGLGLILLLGLSLMGMGKLDPNEKPGTIPIPDREVTALIVDSEGMSLTLTQFSLNGQTVLSGTLGAGKAVVPFDQIKNIHLSPHPKSTEALLELVDLSTLKLTLERGQTAYGKAKFGTYQVSVDRLKKIEIMAMPEKKR